MSSNPQEPSCFRCGAPLAQEQFYWCEGAAGPAYPLCPRCYREREQAERRRQAAKAPE